MEKGEKKKRLKSQATEQASKSQLRLEFPVVLLSECDNCRQISRPSPSVTMEAETLDSSGPPVSSLDPMDVTDPSNPKQRENPPSDSGSDSSDSDDDEVQDKLEIQNLETELSTNPANYDAHVKVRFPLF